MEKAAALDEAPAEAFGFALQPVSAISVGPPIGPSSHGSSAKTTLRPVARTHRWVMRSTAILSIRHAEIIAVGRAQTLLLGIGLMTHGRFGTLSGDTRRTLSLGTG